MTIKIGGQLAPPPSTLFPQKLTDQNFEIFILFSIVERSNKNIFKGKMTPLSPRGEACNLGNLPIVYALFLLLGSIQTFSGGFLLRVGFHSNSFSWGGNFLG